MRKYTQEEKQAAIARYAVSQESVSDILADTGIPRSTFYGSNTGLLKSGNPNATVNTRDPSKTFSDFSVRKQFFLNILPRVFIQSLFLSDSAIG
jgi:hypothetical protein